MIMFTGEGFEARNPRAIRHVIGWRHGGETKVENLDMGCCAHHDQIQAAEWTIDVSTGEPRCRAGAEHSRAPRTGSCQ
jgi:hypothetical protein